MSSPRSARLRWALALGAALACASIGVAVKVRADLEVTLPPGTPSDWYRELPDRMPFVLGGTRPIAREEVVEKEKEEDGKKGGKTKVREKEADEPQVVVKEEAKPEYGGSYKPMMFSGVLTEDLPIHLKWTGRKPDSTPAAYPPPITDDLYWMAQSAYLRRLLHPTMIGENEILWHLVALGQASMDVGGPAKGEAFLTSLITEVEKRVPPLPPEAPKPPVFEGSAEDVMLMKVVTEDLARQDAFSLDPTVAWRTLSLGEDLFPQVEAATRSDHPLLRRNAVVVLGHFESKGALEALRKVFREDKDPVARTRALFQLVRRQDKEIGKDLADILHGADDRMRVLGAWGLGVLGDRAGVEPLLKAIESYPKDGETLTCAVISLARLGDKRDAVLKALKDLVGTLTAAEPRFVEPRVNRPEADIPDPLPLRNRLLLEQAVLALARLDDKQSQKLMADLLAGKWHDGQKPMGHALASGPERSSQCETLKWVCPTSIPAVCETLASMGKAGQKQLTEIAAHEKTNEKLRVALLRLETLAEDKRFLAKLAAEDGSAAVRAVALKVLYQADPKAGTKLAEQVLAKYASGKPMSEKQPKGDVSVIGALEILYKEKKLGAGPLKPVIARALTEYGYEPPKVTAEGVNNFIFTPPLLEFALFMMGDVGKKEAASVLKKVAQDPKGPGRAMAARALGRAASQKDGKEAKEALVELLSDQDPWVRYCAYKGLKEATGQDHYADWVYGTPSDLAPAIAKWKEGIR